MLARPGFSPLIWICVAGVVAPAGMKALGVTLNREVSPETRATAMPPAGAGAPNDNDNTVDCPACTLVLAGMLSDPGWTAITFTVAVTFDTPVALAVMVAEPAPAPVTGMVVLPDPGLKLTTEGTAATFVLLELTSTITAVDGAGDRFRVRFCVAFPLTVSDAGTMLIEAAGGGPPGPAPEPT